MMTIGPLGIYAKFWVSIPPETSELRSYLPSEYHVRLAATCKRARLSSGTNNTFRSRF
jgi:hypothetical protein